MTKEFLKGSLTEFCVTDNLHGRNDILMRDFYIRQISNSLTVPQNSKKNQLYPKWTKLTNKILGNPKDLIRRQFLHK